MKNNLLLISLIFFLSNANAENVKIDQNNDLLFNCELTKNILKNSEDDH